MAESVVDSKILARKTFTHSDTIRSGPITATLYSDWNMTVEREDGYKISYTFSLLVSEEDQMLFFNELANATVYERFKFDRNKEIHLSTAHFAHFLIEQKIPKALAVRLAVVASEIEDAEDLFTSYRNLKQTFFYNQKTGQSSFEIYLMLTDRFSSQFADSVFRLKATSLASLEAIFERLKIRDIHKDAKEIISVNTAESLEAFIILARYMQMSRKQDAAVTSRLVADDGTTDWNLVTALNDRMARQASIADLFPTENGLVTDQFVFESSRNYIMSGINSSVNRDTVVTIFALLLAKYGPEPILQARQKVREDRITDNSLAAFIVATDFIGQTGDTDTNLQWILLLSGDMDEDNFL